MAYYSSVFLEGETGEYHWTPYNTAYDVPFQDSSDHSNFEVNEPKLIEYYPNAYEYSYDHSEIMYSEHDFSLPKVLDYFPNNCHHSSDPYYANRPDVNYSMYNYNEPKVIEYSPTSHQIQYFVSYNTKEFNEPDYVEYDPTPYDGGYDQTITYGKPLPPSDQICYPRSAPKSNDLPLSGFSYNSTSSPYGNNDDSFDKPIVESKPNDNNKSIQVEPIEQIKQNGDDKNIVLVEAIEQVKATDEVQDKQTNGDQEMAGVERFDANYGEEVEGYNNGHDFPWLGYEYGYGNGKFGGYEYEYDKKIVAQTQHGYGTEGMDYCESIFGYWPCLAKRNRKSNGVIKEKGDGGSKSEAWERAAEFIFGSSNSGNACESYYRQQAGYGIEGYYDYKC